MMGHSGLQLKGGRATKKRTGRSQSECLEVCEAKLEKLKAEIYKLIIMVGDCTSLSEIDKFRRQKISKDRLNSSTSVSWI